MTEQELIDNDRRDFTDFDDQVERASKELSSLLTVLHRYNVKDRTENIYGLKHTLESMSGKYICAAAALKAAKTAGLYSYPVFNPNSPQSAFGVVLT